MGEACFAQWDDLWSRGDSTSWTRKAFQEKRCQPFSMIPLERWNVERSGTFCDKRTMTWLIQPIVRFLIRPMERKVSRRARHRGTQRRRWTRLSGRRLCWHTRLGRYDSSGSTCVNHDVRYLAQGTGIKGTSSPVGKLVFSSYASCLHRSRHTIGYHCYMVGG